MRSLGERELDDLATGSAILGAGGGGDPYIGRLIAREAIREHGPVPVLDLDEVPDDALAVFCFLVGAPSVMVEKLPSSRELAQAVRTLEARIGRPVTHLVSIEAGGLNSVTPIGAAARLGLPLVDADGMGRAFPSVAMVTPTLYGIAAAPMALVDGASAVVVDEPSNLGVEDLARAVTVAMGCGSACAAYPMTGEELKRTTIPGTLALAERLGRLVREARERDEDPAAALLGERGGERLFTGKIVSVERRTERGFNLGDVSIEGYGEDAGAQFGLQFQNEHLVATRDGAVVASVPDLLMALDADTGDPIPTEGLRFGFRVTIVAMPCDEKWRTPEGLAIVGPRAFGYEIDYEPVGGASRAA